MKPAKQRRPKCRTLRPEKIIEAMALVPPQPLAIVRSPEQVIADAVKAANILKKIFEKTKHKVFIRGERYLRLEEWQTAGRFIGVMARPTRTEHVEIGGAHGFKAYAEAVLVATGQVISGADAMCMTDEAKWLNRPVYQNGDNGKRVHTHDEPVPHFQRLSMAQTRACSKALRNVCAWVVVLAGYAPTPAEEMDDFNQDQGYGACGRCGEDMYFKDEAKSGICRTCKAKYEETIKDPDFIAGSLAHVAAVKAGKVAVQPPNGAQQA